MLLAVDSHTAVTQFLLFLTALAGPSHPPQVVMPLADKVQALSHYARTGDARRADKLLAEIREKKAWTEKFLAGKEKVRKGLEKAIQNDLELLQTNARERIAKSIQERIADRQRWLDSVKKDIPFYRKLSDDRAKEEKAFVQLYRVIEKMRKELKAP